MKHPGFAKRFKQAVASAGISDSQKGLSKLLGVSEVMIWSYKNGEKLPRMAMAVKMAETFNTTVEWLLQGTGNAVREPAAQYDASTGNSKTHQDLAQLIDSLDESEQKQALELLQKHFT
ncbi:MAG: helix-turn-helix transcriptional regulator [Pseudomonadota bacterium]